MVDLNKGFQKKLLPHLFSFFFYNANPSKQIDCFVEVQVFKVATSDHADLKPTYNNTEM